MNINERSIPHHSAHPSIAGRPMINPATSGPTTAFAFNAPAIESGGFVEPAGDSVTVVVEPVVGVSPGVCVTVTVFPPFPVVEEGLAIVVVVPLVGSIFIVSEPDCLYVYVSLCVDVCTTSSPINLRHELI